MKKKGEEVSAEDQEQLMTQITERYNKQTDVRYAASRIWVDGIINPLDTRARISKALECANLNPEILPYKTGVLQV